jgi:16S rRNA (cytosine967-C5)-methyltransferase
VVDEVAGHGHGADASLARAEAGPERAAIRAIALGTLRWYLRLAPVIESLLEQPARVAGLTRALLVVSAHQVEYSRNAPQAIVHAAVDAARLLGAPRASGLTNAVLRRFVAERDTLLAHADSGLPGRTAHPAWLVERIVAVWPGECAALLEANNAHPPMTLRVDLSRIARAAYLARLAEASIDAHEIEWAPRAVTVKSPMPVSRLPGFAEGLVSVQDAGAQLAVPLLRARPGERILDVCAAPGGKTGQLLEEVGDADVTALDSDAARAHLIEENLARLRRTARVVVADAREPPAFSDRRPFGRILVDAPCSATGVIRRHPDIKLLRRPTDIGAFAEVQLAILKAATTLLEPGGRLVYSTCSVLPEENETVVRELLAGEPRMKAAPMPAASELATGARDCTIGVQLLPGAEAGTDGFYYACVEKTTVGG